MTTPSLTSQLATQIQQKSIDQSDLDAAALFLLDALANAVAGRAMPAGQIILKWIKDKKNDQGRVAFALGALTHIVEMDDLHRTSVTHPGCVIIPAVVAMSMNTKPQGHDILRAILHGFEACTRVGMAVGTEHYEIWHNTATCGPFGSAMAISSLLDLSHQQTVDALGNAGTQSSGFWQFLQTGAMSKHLHAGRAAESGLLAAELASQGFTGPAEIIEGDKGMFAGMCKNPDPEALKINPDDQWQLQQTSIKPWPSCRHTHPVIDAALEIADQIEMSSVKSISIETYQAALNVCNCPEPQSLYEAKFSLQYCVVAALYDGKINFDSFNKQSRKRFTQWTNKVDVSVGASYQSAYPDSWGAKIAVKLTDGAQIAVQRDKCKGDPDMAVSRDDLIEKSKMLMEYGGMNTNQAQELINNILALSENELLSSQLLLSILDYE